MTELTKRAALLGDAQGIWGLFRQVADDIPFDMGSEAAQESILSELMACCTSGLSPVAVDEDKAIVGALLVRRDDFEWGFRNSEAVHVAYAAVAASHRDKGVLRSLLTEVQQRQVPVLASVKNGDQIGFSAVLKELGFAHECTAASGWGDLYKWQPQSAS